MMNKIKEKAVIMMATYNGEKYLKDQLDSLQKQTFTNWELYVSDDASNDKTLQILKKFQQKDKRLKKILINSKFHGPFANYFNVMHYVKKIASNRYDYFFYCDQDDIWVSQKMEMQICALKKLEKENKDIPSFCYSDLELCDKNLNDMHDKISNHITIQFKQNPYNEFFKEQYVWGTAMAHNLALWNMIPVESVNMVHNYISHDSYIARIAAIYANIAYINDTLVMYRRTGNNVTSTPHDYTISQAIKKIFTRFRFVINESARTYRVSLYVVSKVKDKNVFVQDLRNCLLGNAIDSINFFKKYKILEGEKLWGNLATKTILYSGIYKKTKVFKRKIN